MQLTIPLTKPLLHYSLDLVIRHGIDNPSNLYLKTVALFRTRFVILCAGVSIILNLKLAVG